MRIDFAHLVGGKPVIVFDGKYKVADSSDSYPNVDHYQMLAYRTALKLRQGWLLYAQGQGGPRTREVRNASVRVVVYPLDLGDSPRGLLSQVGTSRCSRTAGRCLGRPQLITGVRPVRERGRWGRHAEHWNLAMKAGAT